MCRVGRQNGREITPGPRSTNFWPHILNLKLTRNLPVQGSPIGRMRTYAANNRFGFSLCQLALFMKAATLHREGYGFKNL